MKKNVLIFLVVMVSRFGSLPLYSQPIVEADLETITEMAEERLLEEDYYQALVYYKKAFQLEPSWPIASQIANIQMQLRDYRQAVHWYKLAMEGDRLTKNPTIRYHYAEALKMMGNYDDALLAFQFFDAMNTEPEYAEKTALQIDGIRQAQNAIPDSSVFVRPAGPSVNNKFSETAPFFIDDNTIVFGAFDKELIEDFERHPKNFFMRMYTVTFAENQELQNQEIFRPIHIPDNWHNNLYRISPDGKYRLIGLTKLSGNRIDQTRIYIQEKLSTGWSEPYLVDQPFDDNPIRHAHINYWDDRPCLFYSMNDPDNVSKMDLYYSFYFGLGEISHPNRLPSIINTEASEIWPFLHKNKLYFSSNGHKSFGGFDIYVSEWDGKQWSIPYNLGKDINSPADDFGYVNNAEQTKALFVSNRPGGPSLKNTTCCDNIYLIDYRDSNETIPQLSSHNDPTPADSIPTKAPTPTNQLGIELNEAILLPNIQFPQGDLSLSNNATTDLDLLYGILREYPDWIIELGVHTDARGDDAQNLQITRRQADKLKEYLIRKGIKENRIIAVGYGEKQILNQCQNNVLCSEEDHLYNRRVEFKWIATMPKENMAPKDASTTLGPKMVFEQKLYDLGTVTEGEKREATFRFTNTGDADLVIEFASACTCTSLDWPSLPIKPGASGEIKIVYDSKGKKGLQEVTVDVVANTDPIVVEAFFKIFVKPK